jgi:predicted alpha/beta superfamily hydrolase
MEPNRTFLRGVAAPNSAAVRIARNMETHMGYSIAGNIGMDIGSEYPQLMKL